MRSLIDYANRRGKSKSLNAEAAIGFLITRRGRAPRSDDIGADSIGWSDSRSGLSAMLGSRSRPWRSSFVSGSRPEQTPAAARAKGAERYHAFTEALGRRLAKGPTLLREVSLDVTAAREPDANAKSVNDKREY